MARCPFARRLPDTGRVWGSAVMTLILLCSLASSCDFPGELVARLSIEQAVNTAECAHRFPRLVRAVCNMW